jgi:hypothetical protein
MSRRIHPQSSLLKRKVVYFAAPYVRYLLTFSQKHVGRERAERSPTRDFIIVDHPLGVGHAEDTEAEEVGRAEEIESKHIGMNGSPGETPREIPWRIQEPSPIDATEILDSENAKSEYTPARDGVTLCSSILPETSDLSADKGNSRAPGKLSSSEPSTPLILAKPHHLPQAPVRSRTPIKGTFQKVQSHSLRRSKGRRAPRGSKVLPLVQGLPSASPSTVKLIAPVPEYMPLPPERIILPTGRPAFVFVDDLNVASPLPLAEQRALWGLFSRYARVLGRSGGASDRIYPVDNLMLRDSAHFYKWYTAELRSAIRISLLKVELPCSQRQTERVFLVAAGDKSQFQRLKQIIWDSWIDSHSAGVRSLFDICIEPVPSFGGAGAWSLRLPPGSEGHPMYNGAPNVPAPSPVRLAPTLRMPESAMQGQGHLSSAPHLEVVTEPRYKDD